MLTFRASTDDEPGRSAAVFVLLVLAFSLAASVWRPIAFAGRSEMAVLAVWIWAVARAAARDRSVRIAAGMAAALGLCATLFVVAGPHPRPDDHDRGGKPRAAGPRRATSCSPGRVSTFRPSSRPTAAGSRHASRRCPKATRPIPAGSSRGRSRTRTSRHALRLAEGLPPGGRLFLLLPPAYNAPALMAPLGERGALREIARQDDGVLTVWERAQVRDPRGP